MNRPQPAFDKSRLHYMSRTEKFAAGLAKEKRLAQLLIELEWDQADHTLAESLLGTSWRRVEWGDSS